MVEKKAIRPKTRLLMLLPVRFYIFQTGNCNDLVSPEIRLKSRAPFVCNSLAGLAVCYALGSVPTLMPNLFINEKFELERAPNVATSRPRGRSRCLF